MNYQDRDIYSTNKNNLHPQAQSSIQPLMGADTLIGEDVYNHEDENLGDIKEIMLDIHSGKIAYAVLSFGGFLGMGEKLFAVPWKALTLDMENKRFVLPVDKERLKQAPGFDADNWPDMADLSWEQEIHTYYGIQSNSDNWNN